MFDQLSDKINSSLRKLRGQGVLTEKNIESTLREIRMALLEADVNFKVVKGFIASVQEKALGQAVLKGINPGQQLVQIVHEELTRILGEGQEAISFKREPPAPLLLVGLQGAGKTTLSAKLALFLKKKLKKSPVLVPADIHRPAAKKQLEVLGSQIQIPVFDSDLTQSPLEIAKAARPWAIGLGADVLIIDTAGRSQVDDVLMKELTDLKEGIDPAEVLFVADAMIGQEAVNVACSFHERVGLTGIALTKMDGDARGGAALSIRQITGLPIKVISTGEKTGDLEPFYPDRVASRILDMGDVLSLVERASEVINEEDAQELQKKLKKNEFTVEDFAKQLKQISKLGSMESILKMLPGMGGMMAKIKDFSPAEKELKRIEAIIGSMTVEERQNYKILNSSRRKRIARGSGTTVQDVNSFIKKFTEMRNMMSKFSKMGMGKMGFPGMKFPF